MEGIELLLLVLGILFIYILVSIGVYHVAEKNGRDSATWVIISLLISPIVPFIILLCIGETTDNREEKIIKEELLRKKIREGIICSNCHIPNDKENKFCISCGTEL